MRRLSRGVTRARVNRGMTPREFPQPAWTAASASGTARRLLPFVAVATIGALVTIAAVHVDVRAFAIALVLQAIAGVTVLALPWDRLPSWAGAVPALFFLAGVAFLRDAAGGAFGGVGALALLPILWFA